MVSCSAHAMILAYWVAFRLRRSFLQIFFSLAQTPLKISKLSNILFEVNPTIHRCFHVNIFPVFCFKKLINVFSSNFRPFCQKSNLLIQSSLFHCRYYSFSIYIFSLGHSYISMSPLNYFLKIYSYNNFECIFPANSNILVNSWVSFNFMNFSSLSVMLSCFFVCQICKILSSV